MKLAAEHYKRYFDTAIDLLCIANTDGYFLEINPAFCNLLGFSAEELMSRPFLEYIHPDDVEPTLQQISQLTDGVDTVSFKNRYRDANGKYLVISWASTLDRETGLIFAVARDFSSVEKAIHNSSQIELAMKEKAIFARTDSNGVITEVNDLFCEISGYSKDELIGQTHKLINSGLHPEQFFQDMWATISSGAAWNGVIRNQKKNGDYYFVETIITPTFDLEGNIDSYIAIRSDITESIDNAATLSKTLDVLNETNSIAKVGGWELDIATNELTWTDQTFRILEVDKKDGQKPTLPDGLKLFTEECQPVIEDAVSRAIEHGEPYSLELEAQSAKGRVFWVYTNGSPNYKDGKIVSLSGTIQDINDKKIAELNYEKERQKSIQNSKLASLGELAASMAHEINNPLTAIMGNTELMQLGGDLDESFAEKLESITRSCERISHIVKSLKKFSRTGKKSEQNVCDLNSIVEEAINLAMPRLSNLLVDMQFLRAEPILIKCNEIEIEQVILNLINNSIDAISQLEERWIKIQVSQKNGPIELLIMDSGSGIP